MRIVQALSLVSLIGLVSAAGPVLEKRGRAECIEAEATKARDARKDADAVICYHGTNSATTYIDMPFHHGPFTKKDPATYGFLWYTKCGKIGLDCFWLKADNAWKGDGDGGYDNIFIWHNDKCTYDPKTVEVFCST